MSFSDDDNQGDGVGESSDNASPFLTNELFSSVDELKDWAKMVGREVGVVIVTQRSKTNVGGEVVKVWLKCDHGGAYNCTAIVRRSGSIKTGCNFSLVGNYIRQCNGWRLRVVDNKHNHELVQHFEGHAYAGRLTPIQKVMVHDMYRNRAPPHDILCNLKSKDERNATCIKTVYNEGQKIRKEDRRGKSPMEVLFNLLQDTSYIHNHRTNPSTNALEDLFFVHPTSYMIYRAFPHVLVIDTTYNTNVYKMPFVQIVGVTSTGKTFHIAMAAISNEKEDDFTRVLTMLKTTLDNCMLPRVILTDCDLALMNACETVFPNAAKLLCRWHINENIKKHCRQSFTTAEEYEQFLGRWNWLIWSSTLPEYESRYKRLYDTLIVSHKRVLDYVDINWLNKYKEKFVSAWIDQNLNFGNTTTNRVESAHALLKKHMVTRNSTLDKLVGIIDRILVGQLTAIKATFEDSRKKTMNHHNLPVFNELRRHVSHKALDILWDELNRVNKLMESGRACECHIRTSCGMPCACMISKFLISDRTIPLDSIDIYWRKLDFDQLFVDEDEGLDSKANELAEEFVQQFKKESKGGKKSMLSKFMSLMMQGSSTSQQPAIQKHTWGRPTTKSKENSKREPPLKRSNSTSLSINEIMPTQEDPSRHSSFIGVQNNDTHMSYMLCQDNARHSSYVGSQDNAGHNSVAVSQVRRYHHKYLEQVHDILQPFVSHIQDVAPDGNCGFRSTAVALGRSVDDWIHIRSELIQEMVTNWHVYIHVFGDAHCNEIYKTLHWSGDGIAPREHWMSMSSTALMIANKYGVIVHSLSVDESNNSTLFPLLYRPQDNPPPAPQLPG